MKSPMKGLTNTGKNVNVPPKMPPGKVAIQRDDPTINGDRVDLVPGRNGDLGGFPEVKLPDQQSKKPFSGLKG